VVGGTIGVIGWWDVGVCVFGVIIVCCWRDCLYFGASGHVVLWLVGMGGLFGSNI